ncbi:50S ribosomal protein L10 [Thermodesulfobacteriota bacterium]
MNREEKRDLVERLRGRLEKVSGTFVVDYKGLNVEAISKLRKELRDVDAEFEVVKNRLLKLASEDTDTGLCKEHMQGPTAIAYSYDDVIGPAKVLMKFAKDFDQLDVKVCQISGKLIDKAGVKRLADLPGREELLAQTLSVMQAVPASFVRILGGMISQLMNVLKAIEKQKEASA